MWQRKMNPYRSVQHTSGNIIVNVRQEHHENNSERNQTLNTKVTNGSVLDKDKSLLSKELEETKAELQRQKALKELFINKGKETKQELEILRKYSNQETLNAAKIATLVWDNIKRKKKRDLQNDFEELRVAFITNEGRYELDLQAERKKNMALQNEVEKLRVLVNEVNPGCKPDASIVREEVGTLQEELKKEVEQKNELRKCYEELQEAHRLSQDKLTAELLVEREKIKFLHEDLEKICEVNQKYVIDIISVRQQIDSLQRELDQEVQQKKRLQLDLEEVQAAHALSQQSFAVELKIERVKSTMLQEELEVIRLSHQLISQKCDSDVITLTKQAETLQSKSDTEAQTCELVTQCEELPEDKGRQEQQSLPGTPVSQPLTEAEFHPSALAHREEEKEEEALTILQEEAAVSEEVPPERKKTPSVWKRMRHRLGLRKPKCLKKKKSPE